MLSIQEIVSKCVDQLRQVKYDMSAKGFFDPSETASVYNHPDESIRIQVKETLRRISLQELLMKSGTTGIAGAAYLIPDKLHDDLIFYAGETDICPLISAYMVNGWQGGDLAVDVVNPLTYRAHPMISGAQAEDNTDETKKVTLTPKGFGINIPIGGDLVEDNPHGLVEWHVRQAAKACGKLATNYALTVLKTATSGWGTLNSSAADAAETKFSGSAGKDITSACRGIGDDEWIANTVVCTPEAFYHSIAVYASTIPTSDRASDPRFHAKIADLSILKSTSDCLHASTDAKGATMTECITLVFDRNNALLTGRKRWMRIENYSDPRTITQGAVVSCRQDSVTLYNDAVYKLTEA